MHDSMRLISSLFRLLAILAIAICSCLPIASAQVWPGDINRDGLADHRDLLYLGYAYGEVGPRRDSLSIEWSAQNILANWDQHFPDANQTNYAHADCNGDGIVDALDMLAIQFNFFHFNDFVNPSNVEEGIPGIDPPFSFAPHDSAEPILEGSLMEFPINLGSTAQSISDFNGMAFSIHYDPEAIEPGSIWLDFSEAWPNPDGQSLLQFQKNDVNAGRLDIAVSRFGQAPIDGEGQIARLSFIIVDDVIDFLPDDSLFVDIRIEQAEAIDGDFDPIPIVNDTLWLKVVSPDYFLTSNRKAIAEKDLRIFPNPAMDILHIQAPRMGSVTVSLHDQLGRQIISQSTNNQRLTQIDIHNLTDGVYVLHIQSHAIRLSRKIIVKRHAE